MQPRVWRAFAFAIGALLSALIVANIVAALFANGDAGFQGEYAPDEPGVYIIRKMTQPDSVVGDPLHVGAHVRLADTALANRLRFLRERPGDRFEFVELVHGRITGRFVDTIVRAPVSPNYWAVEVAALVFAAVGLIVALRRPGDPIARTMVGLFFSLGALYASPVPWLPAWATGAVVIAQAFAQVYSAYAALALASTFPIRSAAGVRRWFERVNPWFTVFSLATLFSALIMRLVFLNLPPRWLNWLGIAETFSYFIAITVAFVIASRIADVADRKRVRWVAWSLAVGFSGTFAGIVQVVAGVPFAEWEQVLGLTLIAIPLGLGYAIVRHRVVDIGFVVNRALVFGALSAIVVVAFMVLEWALSSVAMRMSHITSTTLELALALGLGFSMRSLHTRVDRLVEDVFFRERHRTEEALRTLARDVGYITDPRVAVTRVYDELEGRSGATFTAILVVDGAVMVRIDPQGRAALPVSIDDPALVRMRATRAPCTLQGLASALPGDHAFPMLVRDALSGVVVLGPKENGEAYAPDELATVETVALALGNALDALQNAALKREIARVLVEGAPLDALRRTIDPAAWIRSGPQPTGPLVGLGE